MTAALSVNASIVLCYLCDAYRHEPRLMSGSLLPEQKMSSVLAGLVGVVGPRALRAALTELDKIDAVYRWEHYPDRVRLTVEGVHILLNNHERLLATLRTSKKVPLRFVSAIEELVMTVAVHPDDPLGLNVPAADRFVSVRDNRKAFNDVVGALAKVRHEFAADHNKNLIPSDVKAKADAEIEGFLAQISKGFVSKVSAKGIIVTLQNIEKIAIRVAAASAAVGFAIVAIRKAFGL
jgi:hypothetical protein